MQVHPESALRDKDLLEDYPINMLDDSLLKESSKLPCLRFLHHDQELLELTFEILLWAARAGFQNSAGDRNKMEQLLQLMIKHFYKLNFAQISQRSKTLKLITDEEIQKAFT